MWHEMPEAERGDGWQQRRKSTRSTGSRRTGNGSPRSTWRSGATPNRPGASIARRAPMSTCCAPRASPSRKARAGCRPPSAPPGARAARCWRAYAEYDAVPGNSQQVVPRRAPREGLHPAAAGHTDPHSMLGVAALTGHAGGEGGDGAARHQGDAEVLRRTGGEGLRLEADPRGEGLLRRRSTPSSPTTPGRRTASPGRPTSGPTGARSIPSSARSPRPGSTAR